MKLLFDENLSDRLVPAPADFFPASIQVKAIGLMQQPDASVWDYAKLNGFVIVTKDADFHERSIVEGAPPKIVFLRVGNCSTADVRDLLAGNAAVIETFGRSVTESALVLGNIDLI